MDTEMVLALQRLPLRDLMRAVSLLGDDTATFPIVAALAWCYDRRAGTRLALMMVLSALCITLSKLWVRAPRPYWVDPRVEAHDPKGSYGLPSSHTLQATAGWGLLAAGARSPWARAGLAGVPLAIGISRIGVGAHFPSQVAASWGLGGALLGAFLLLERPLAEWLGRRPLWQQAGLAAAAVLGYLGAAGAVHAAIRARPDPAAWADQAARAAPRKGPIAPRNPRDVVYDAGSLLGVLLGIIAAGRCARFDARGPLRTRILRFGLGITGLLGIWQGLDVAARRRPGRAGLIVTFVSYALSGFWTICGAPWLFLKIGLAAPEGSAPAHSRAEG